MGLEGLVEVGDIGPEVLAIVEAEGFGGDNRRQGVVCVGEVGQGEGVGLVQHSVSSFIDILSK
jgi:hypothetical protein